jgi:transposase InsO family protein
MPWKATDTMKERTKFVLEWERRWDEAEGGAINMAELCRLFGISRQTGYTWIERYRAANHDLEAVAERSRRPKTSPTAISPELEDIIVATKKRYPKWGPRKLHARLVETNPGCYVPSSSVMGKILKRRGLTTPRRRRRRAAAVGVKAPFSGCEEPNAVWCIDFKGWFVTGDGVRCYPLTLIDAFSRYLLRCEALTEPDGRQVQRILESAFTEFGLPLAMRSDGGPPFASTGPARLTELSVWLLRLGIRIEIIAPGKPQQNGRLERFHRTLKDETASPPADDCIAQQRVFDLWRGEYNHERPHEALGQRRPGRIYMPSKHSYPRPLLKRDFDLWTHVARVDRNGNIKWQRRNVFISSALKYEYVEIEASEDADGRWNVRWGEIVLGYLDEHRPDRGLVYPRRRRGHGEVSGMSYDSVSGMSVG